MTNEIINGREVQPWILYATGRFTAAGCREKVAELEASGRYYAVRSSGGYIHVRPFMSVSDIMRRERHPDLIVSACGPGNIRDLPVPKGATGVTTADDQFHLVKDESYDWQREPNLLSLCVPFES